MSMNLLDATDWSGKALSSEPGRRSTEDISM